MSEIKLQWDRDYYYVSHTPSCHARSYIDKTHIYLKLKQTWVCTRPIDHEGYHVAHRYFFDDESPYEEIIIENEVYEILQRWDENGVIERNIMNGTINV